MAQALSWDDATKFARDGGYAKYGSTEAWQASQNAVPAPPAPTTSAPTPTALWMGSMYSNVPGTDMYSTNPSNPNSTKYKADGTPVPSLSFDFNKTGGGSYDGYATPEQFQQIRNAPNPAAAAGIMQGFLNAGQLNQSNDAIYKATSVPAPPSMVASMQSSGGSSPSSVPAPKLNPYNEILYSKEQWEGNAGNYGAQAWAENNAKQYYSMLDPTEAAKVRDMNAAELQAYMKSMTAQPAPSQGATPAPTGPAPTAPSTPVPAPTGYPAMTPQQIRAEVESKIAAEVQKRTQAANQAKQGLQTSYDRLRSTTNDTRTLEDTKNARSLNPFSGRSDYAQGMIARERAITDRQQQEDLATRLANIDVSLQDYINATPEQQRAMENELIRQERAYANDVAQLTGNLPDGSRTLAGQQLDWNRDPNNPANVSQALANKLAQLKLDNYPEEVRQAAQLFEQQLKSGQISIDTAAWKLQELQDPNSTTNQAAKLDLQLKQMEADYLPQEQKLKLQQLQKQIQQIGAAPYRSEEERQLDQVKLDTARETYNQLKNGSKQTDLNSFVNQLTSLYVSKDPYSGQQSVSNPQALRNAIIAKGLSDDQTDQLLLMFGLPTN